MMVKVLFWKTSILNEYFTSKVVFLATVKVYEVISTVSYPSLGVWAAVIATVPLIAEVV